MDEKALKKLNKYLIYGLTIFSFAYILVLILIAVLRINYPFELEWMEGGQVEHVARILEGKQIYVAPGIEFIPYIYTPLYSYLSASVALITEVGFFPLRLISLTSTVLILLFIFLFVKRETNNYPSAIIAMGLYASTFKLSGYWMDLGRVDSLFLLFFLISVFFMRSKDKPSSFILAGIFAALSFLTKQSVIFMLAPIIVYMFFRKYKYFWHYCLSLGVLAISVSAYFNIISDGWYFYWNFGLPSGHHWNLKIFYYFWTNDLIEPLGIIFFISILFLMLRNQSNEPKGNYSLICILIGSLLDSWLLRLHYGGYLNSLMPAFLAFSMITGIGIMKILNYFKDLQGEKYQYIKLFILTMIFAQFVILIYNPLKALPSKSNEIAGWNFINKLKKIEGNIYAPCHSYTTKLAGKKSYAHYVVVNDLFISRSHYKQDLLKSIQDSLRLKKFSAIIIDSDCVLPGLKEHYKFSTDLTEEIKGFSTVTGSTREEYLFIPKSQ